MGKIKKANKAKRKALGIPLKSHPLQEFIASCCPHCDSNDLMVKRAALAGYHPGGNWVVVAYTVFCNSCQLTTEGSGSNVDS